jgi:thiol reductant ABC exporter CydD subunit
LRALDARLVRRVRAVRALLVADVALGVATTVVILIQASLLAGIVSRAFDGAPAGHVAAALVLLVAAFAARGLLGWGFEVAGRRAATATLSGLRLELVERRLRAQPAALDGVEGAEIAAAAVQGIDGLQAYFGRYLPQVVLACLVPVAVLAWVGAVDATSALVMLVTLPLVPVFMWLIGRSAAERTRERWQALRLLSKHFLDVVRGLPTLRALNRAQDEAATLEAVGERYRQATMGTLRIAFLSGSVLELAATLGVALVAVTVGVRMADGGLGLRAGLTVLILAPELYAPLRALGTQFHASADGLAVADRMQALLDAPAEAAVTAGPVAPAAGDAVIRFEDVSFAYPARPAPVLEGLDLALHPGETVALVGTSGVGKSTVVMLLLGLARPAAGRITVDGVDLAECDADAWRRQLAWVPQRPTMFRGSVADNIRLGDAGASDDRIRDAARRAGADVFVEALPDGYDTVIGDGGRALSAGERRRIALARAFLRDAPLVVLDEPTADLDPASAELVADAVERLSAGRTVLVIAHRPELVQRADRVVELQDGGVCVPARSGGGR